MAQKLLSGFLTVIDEFAIFSRDPDGTNVWDPLDVEGARIFESEADARTWFESKAEEGVLNAKFEFQVFRRSVSVTMWVPAAANMPTPQEALAGEVI